MKVTTCPKCQSQNIYFSKKRQLYICEDCEETFNNNESSTKKIFFSYAHDENEWLVKELKADLEKRGLSIWIDKSDIKTGDNWREAITEGLMSSYGVVSFLSKHAVRIPGVCLDELRLAILEKYGNIKTVLLEDEKDVLIPSSISNIQWLDFSNWKEQFNNKETWDNWYTKRLIELESLLLQDDFTGFTGEIEQLKISLKVVISNTKENFLLSKTFVGRSTLINDFDTWRETSKEKVFILYGKPGMGKSAFACHLLHYNPYIIGGIFCEWDKESQRDAKNVIKQLIFKLATKLPDYRKIIIKRINYHEENFLDKLSSIELFTQLIIEPLQAMIHGNREKQVIIIDGLDEAGTNEANELAMIISRYAKELPNWLCLLVTSRPENIIKQLFNEYDYFEYTLDDEVNNNDIRVYLYQHLSNYLQLNNLEESLLDNLVDKCEGSFLYATLLCESICNNTLEYKDLFTYPKGLQYIYHQNFRRLFNNKEVYYQNRHILEVLLASDKLPLTMLCQIVGISKYQLHEFKVAIGSFINEFTLNLPNLSYEYYSFCHKSLIDWLTDPNQSGIYYIDITEGYQRILTYFKDHINMQVKEEEIDTLNDFYDAYIRNNIIAYFIKLNNWRDLSDFLLDLNTPLFPYWRALVYFPMNYNFDLLLDRLMSDPERNSFFKKLQNYGESKYVEEILTKLSNRFGLASFDQSLFETYVDIVHLRGNYELAVILYQDYLGKYTKEEIIHNNILLHYQIRMIHHKMFFKPVQGLINEALSLLPSINKEQNKQDYFELLFLLGGNLGVLSGDFIFASNWLEKAHKYSEEVNNYDSLTRVARKEIDLLIYNKQYDKAILLFNKIGINNDIDKDYSWVKTRYQVYLLASLGLLLNQLELNGKKGQFTSIDAFEHLITLTSNRGMRGWLGHAYLGLAKLYIDKDLTKDSENINKIKTYLNKAKELYIETNQLWGLINQTIVNYIFNQVIKEDNLTVNNELLQALAKAKACEYQYEISIINKLLNKQLIKEEYQLFFL